MMLTTMGSSKQLSKDFRMKTVHFHRELPISTVRNIIRKWKTNEVEVKTWSGRPRKISDRMAQDMRERYAQKNPHITAKELQKGVANTGLAVHRTTIQHTLNSKDLHGRAARKNNQHKIKRLKYAKENIEKPEAFWNTRPKFNFLATAFVEKWWIHCALGMCGSWEHRKYCASGR